MDDKNPDKLTDSPLDAYNKRWSELARKNNWTESQKRAAQKKENDYYLRAHRARAAADPDRDSQGSDKPVDRAQDPHFVSVPVRGEMYPIPVKAGDTLFEGVPVFDEEKYVRKDSTFQVLPRAHVGAHWNLRKKPAKGLALEFGANTEATKKNAPSSSEYLSQELEGILKDRQLQLARLNMPLDEEFIAKHPGLLEIIKTRHEITGQDHKKDLSDFMMKPDRHQP